LSALRARACASAASTTSNPSNASQRCASIAVSTPIEQPASSPLAKRARGRAAMVAAYLRAS